MTGVMNWKLCWRKQSRPIFRHHPSICMERMRKTKKKKSK